MDEPSLKRRIDAYEESHPRLTRAERDLIAARAPYRGNEQPQAPARRYPLGVDADPHAGHRTAPNRKAVQYVLNLLWANPDAFADRTTSRDGSSAVGLPINGRMVTRIEVTQAVAALQHDRADWYYPLWWLFGRNFELPDAASQLGISESTFRARVRDGLNRLVDELWR
jgi:hypothetical protein